jgi:hypothetical protein
VVVAAQLGVVADDGTIKETTEPERKTLSFGALLGGGERRERVRLGLRGGAASTSRDKAETG